MDEWNDLSTIKWSYLNDSIEEHKDYLLTILSTLTPYFKGGILTFS